MPGYIFTARDSSGKFVSGNQDAPSESAAASILQGKGLYVTHLMDAMTVVKAGSKRRRLKKGLKTEDLLFFISQTATLLTVGIPFVRVLGIISELTDSQKMYDVIQELSANIRSGATFKDAISRHPKIFPAYWAFLVEAGEAVGSLPKVLTQLAKNIEDAENLKKKLITAMVYPTILTLAALGVIIFFMMFIVPIFSKLFNTFHGELPLMTKIVIRGSEFLNTNALLILACIVGIVYGIRKYIRSPKGLQGFHVLLLNIPLFGGVIRDVIHVRIGITLSMLLRSGLNFLKSLEITSNVTGNYIFETAISQVRLDVQQGKTFSAALSEQAIFSPMFVNLVRVGEEGGKLPEMIEKSSDYFSQRVDTFAARIGILIEPLVMIFVGGVIGVIGLSIFLPIIRLTSVVH